jgi:hypothetical protein
MRRIRLEIKPEPDKGQCLRRSGTHYEADGCSRLNVCQEYIVELSKEGGI